ncbi:hypothetical protein Tco_1226420 [Tanacetum coccineum]
MMDDNRTMAQLLEAPTVGYEDAIVSRVTSSETLSLSTVCLPSSLLDEVPIVPSTDGKAYAFYHFPSRGHRDLVEKEPLDDLTWDDRYSQEVLGFFDLIASGNPTPYYDRWFHTIFDLSFGDSDFLLLEGSRCFLALKEIELHRKVDDFLLWSGGGIILLP